MCYSDDAIPPFPPIRGGAPEGEQLVLTSSDGTRFAAYGAHAESHNGAGLVILPDIRGLHPFYEELALRFAETGLNAVAIDYFGRTAGSDTRDDSFEFRSHVEKTTPEQIALDAGAGVAWLKSPEGGGCTDVFSVGFCFGGSNSWNQGAANHGLAGCIGFYGQPQRTEQLLDRMKSPLLLLIAGADFTPTEAYRKFEGELTRAGVEYETHTYEGAPHSFFDRTFKEHTAACDDAWQRMLDFMSRHRTPAAASA
ncbi:MAG: dienelactone hydrolase family protein [Candidatus Dormibacteria bacterium]